MVFLPTIVAQARNLASVNYQALGEKLRVPFANMDMTMHQVGLLNAGESLATKTQEMLSSWFGPTLVGDFLGKFVGAAGSVMVSIATITFILFFFLKEPDLFLEILHTIVPKGQEHKMKHVVQESSRALTRYFTGLLIQVSCYALILTIILLLFGVQNALLIGAFGGIMIVIPYVGPVMGTLFGCFITISSHLELDFNLVWPMLLKVLGAFTIVQLLNDAFISTIIFSKSVQAHPLEIFIVILVAAKLGGMEGMVIGIPVYTVMRVVARIYFSQLKVVQRLTGSMDEPEPDEEVFR
jgi:predicted PurR-regulated permease PerM